MAFAYAKIKRFVSGPYIWYIYSYTNGALDTGGEIITPLKSAVAAFEDTETSAAGTNVKVELNTASAGRVTITTVADEDGRIVIIGH